MILVRGLRVLAFFNVPCKISLQTSLLLGLLVGYMYTVEVVAQVLLKSKKKCASY